jgi:hypothetical protein
LIWIKDRDYQGMSALPLEADIRALGPTPSGVTPALIGAIVGDACDRLPL